MTVHSTQLGYNNALGTVLTTLYTAPSGKRTIVKGIQIYNGAAAANQVTVEVTNAGGLVVTFNIHLGATGSATDTQLIDLWMVMNAGDSLKMVAGSAGVRVLVSGAELNL